MVEKKQFSQEDRTKLDIRVSPELNERVEAVAARLGTTKNSVVAVAMALFCTRLEKAAGKKRPSEVEIEAALRELAA